MPAIYLCATTQSSLTHRWLFMCAGAQNCRAVLSILDIPESALPREPRRDDHDRVGGSVLTNIPGNELLAALPPLERARFLELCEPVILETDDIVAAKGARIHHAYFPIDCFVSLLTGVTPHDSLALGLVGREGMLGTSIVLGMSSSPLHARVQAAGNAFRIAAADLRRALADVPTLEHRLRRYIDVEFAQLALTASCAVFHVAEPRLAYWLLMAHDRTDGDRLYLTHDRLATMLGIRRSGVTLAAGVLQRAGLITYTRGHIAIVDRKGLERAACSCYRPLRDSFREVVRPLPPARSRRANARDAERTRAAAITESAAIAAPVS